MNGDPSTPYSRDLGDELRQLRLRHATHGGRRFSRMLGWDQAKVSNIENGKVRASEIDLVQYLGRCGRSQKFVEDFLDRYRSAFDHYFVQVPTNLRTMAMAESSAQKITTYDLATIPGLLQTEEYALALYEAYGVLTPELIEAAVRFRIERQAILRRHDRPECVFYVHENALRLKVGSDKVIEDQLMRLLFHTHALRIVPAASGPGGVLMAHYVLWEYEKLSSVAYTESDLAQVFVQDLRGSNSASRSSRTWMRWPSVGNNRDRWWRTSPADRGRTSMTADCTWRKSSYSGGNAGDECVEVAFAQAVHVRDSKNTAGPELKISIGACQAFVQMRRV